MDTSLEIAYYVHLIDDDVAPSGLSYISGSTCISSITAFFAIVPVAIL